MCSGDRPRPGRLQQARVDRIARRQLPPGRPALVAEGNGEGLKGQMGESASEPGPVDGDYTGAFIGRMYCFTC